MQHYFTFLVPQWLYRNMLRDYTGLREEEEKGREKERGRDGWWEALPCPPLLHNVPSSAHLAAQQEQRGSPG